MSKFSCGTLLFFLVSQVYQCDANTVTEIKANRLASYDGLSCTNADVIFLQTDVRSRVECVTRCFELSDCACVFYKQDYCQGCHGMCHHGISLIPLPGTAYYFIDERMLDTNSADEFSFNGTYSYLIGKNKTTWQDAQTYCESQTMTLVYIETRAELENITTQLDQVFHWSGGELSGIQYVWSHSGAPINMTLFADGQPNDNDMCVGMRDTHNYQLSDYDCNNLAYFICKSY